jgi:hypothetical protein
MRIAHGLMIAAFAALSIAFSSAQAQQSGVIMAPGDAAVTGFSGVPAQQSSERIDRGGPSLRVIGLPGSGPFGLVNTPMHFTATANDIGQVFGVALDNRPAPDIFAAATVAYGLGIYRLGHGRMRYGAPGAQYTPGQFGPADQGGGPGSIWRIDGQSGQVSLFANVAFNGIQNMPASLGALAFDANTQQLFVSDRATGLIHRFAMDGTDHGVFDHGVQGRQAAQLPPVPFDPASLANIESRNFDSQDSRSWGFAPEMRRVFALAVHNGRLYYSVAANSQIWSVGIASNGAFAGDARFETAAPALRPGTEISQITFDNRGDMYAAERGAPTGSPDFVDAAAGGQNRVLRFVPKQPGDPSPGYWHAPADEYAIGMPPAFQNADGGVGLSCGRTLWSTGDRLLDPGNARPGSFPAIDGLQGNDSNLVRPANTPPLQAWFVNYYDNQADPGSRGHMGSIAIWNVCGGGSAPPPPPATGYGCPPGTFFVGGACLIAPICPVATVWRNGYCAYPHCPDGFVTIRGECRPPPVRCRVGEVFVDDRCIPIGCPPRLERATNGYCRCPNDLVYRDGECAPPCPRDQVYRDGRCVPPCPPDQQYRDGKCMPPCPNDEQRNADGRCVPPPCPNNEQRNADGRCVPPPCPNNEQRNVDGRCVPPPCPNGETRNSDGLCGGGCPPGIAAVANCPCPTGERRNSDGRCYKPNTTVTIRHRCPDGEVRRDGRCTSPNGSGGSSGLGCSRAEYDRLGYCPSTKSNLTTTPHHCANGEVYRDGQCVLPGGSGGAGSLGCSRAEYDRLGHCPNTKSNLTTTTHHCPNGEVYRDGHCVSSGGSGGSSSMGCSRAVYDSLGHCPTSKGSKGAGGGSNGLGCSRAEYDRLGHCPTGTGTTRGGRGGNDGTDHDRSQRNGRDRGTYPKNGD